MPLRNARPSRTISHNSCIWISDQLLDEAFRRFSAACVSSRRLTGDRCLRTPAAIPSSQAPAYSTSAGHSQSSRPSQSPFNPRPRHGKNTCTRTSNATYTFESRRHAHNVPGPLEARRRSTRRRLNLAAGGVQAGSGPVWDPGVFLDDLWGRPKQPYWEWQPPTRRQQSRIDEHIESQERKKRVELPSWMTVFGVQHHAPMVMPVSTRPPDAMNELRSAWGEFDTQESAIRDISTKEHFKARLGSQSGVDEVTALYQELSARQMSDLAFSTEAFEHLLSCYLSQRTLERNRNNANDLSRMIDFAIGTGHWQDLILGLCSRARQMEADCGSVAEGKAMLEVLKSACLKDPQAAESTWQLLQALDCSMLIAPQWKEQDIVAFQHVMNEWLDSAVQSDIESLLQHGSQLRSPDLVLLLTSHITNRLKEWSTERLRQKNGALILEDGLINLLRRSRASIIKLSMRGMVQALFETLSRLKCEVIQERHARTLLDMALILPTVDLTSEPVLIMVKQVLADHRGSDLTLLSRYSKKLLERLPLIPEELSGFFFKTKPVIAQLLDQSSPEIAHAWFLQVSHSFINRFAKNQDSRQLELFNRWAKWASYSSRVREAQQDLGNPHVQDFFYRLLDVFRPSQTPHCLTMLRPQAVCRVLIGHYLVRPEVHESQPKTFLSKRNNRKKLHEQSVSTRRSQPATNDASIMYTLQSLADDFEVRRATMDHQWLQEKHQAYEHSTTRWLKLSINPGTSEYTFGSILDQAVLPALSKQDIYNVQQSILRIYPEGVLPYLALLGSLNAFRIPSSATQSVLLEMILFLDATNHKKWNYYLLLGAKSLFNMRFSPPIEAYIATLTGRSAMYYPSQALGLLNKSYNLWLDEVPNLIENLIASPASQVHPKQIMAIFWYLERDDPPNKETIAGAKSFDAPNRQLSDMLVSQIHDACLFFANASRFSTRSAWDCICKLYGHLKHHRAPIDSRVSRALVIAGVMRPIQAGKCYQIPRERFIWILRVVRELEGEDIADQIDLMTRQAEKRQSAQASAEMNYARRRHLRGKLHGRPGTELGPRIGDVEFEEQYAHDRRSRELGSWKNRQKKREGLAGTVRRRSKASDEKDPNLGGYRYI